MVIKQFQNFTANKVLTNTRLLFVRALESRLTVCWEKSHQKKPTSREDTDTKQAYEESLRKKGLIRDRIILVR